MYSPASYDSVFSANNTLNTSRTEPMTMSPASSPLGGPVNQYLPSYLIGDPSTAFSPSSPRIWPMAGSPGKQRRSFGPSNPSPTNQGNVSIHQMGHNQLTATSNRTPTRTFGSGRMSGVKPSTGPPVVGLLETMMSPISTGNRDGKIMEDSSFNESFGPGSFTGTPNASYKEQYARDLTKGSSPAQIDPFYTQGEEHFDELDETWVTVFGFPSAAASYILQQFSQYGTILEHKVEPNGNWMHIHYQSKLQAKKALSKNGKVFGSSVMVGVKPCIEKKIMDESGKENSVSWRLNRSEDGSRANNIRPLAQAYKTSSNERNVQNPSNTPTKSSLISRTMDYMFGY